MKILVVHNYYGSSAPSGENRAVDSEIGLLRQHGHRVVVAAKASDEIRNKGLRGTITGALSSVWNPMSKREIVRHLERERPDIVHVHNVFPLHSPSVFYGMNNIPVVYTLHNYRLGCAAGTATRKNAACFECFERKSVIPALRYGCYRESRIATVPMAASIMLHRSLRTWWSKIDAFVTLTEYQRSVMLQYGLPSERIFVKPHFGTPAAPAIDWTRRENKVVFIGRLYEAKGIHHAVDAWKTMGEGAPTLEIIGDGPLRASLERSVETLKLSSKVFFTGQLPHETAMRKLATAKMVLVPSLCPEGFPMVIHEAYSHGIPVAASNAGSLRSLVREGVTGILFSPGSGEEIASRMMSVWRDDAALQAMHAKCLEEFNALYTPEKNHEQLMRIYESAQNIRRGR